MCLYDRFIYKDVECERALIGDRHYLTAVEFKVSPVESAGIFGMNRGVICIGVICRLFNKIGIDTTRRIVLLVGLWITVVLLTIGAFVFYNLGNLLVVESKKVKTLNCVCSFAGEKERLQYANDLFNNYPNTIWVISVKDTNEASRLVSVFTIDTSRVMFIYGAESTLDEIKKFARLLKILKRNKMVVGLVSSSWHMRRIWVIAGRYMKIPGVKKKFLPVPEKYYRRQRLGRSDLMNWRDCEKTKKYVIKLWLETGYDFVRCYLPIINHEKMLVKWKAWKMAEYKKRKVLLLQNKRK